MAWRVLKSLYGTKQAPAIWHKVLKDWLHTLGWEPTQADPCVFVKRNEDDFFFIGVHVDDLLMVTTSVTMLTEFKHATTERFSFKDQGGAIFGHTTKRLWDTSSEPMRKARPQNVPSTANNVLYVSLVFFCLETKVLNVVEKHFFFSFFFLPFFGGVCPKALLVFFFSDTLRLVRMSKRLQKFFVRQLQV
jgi:hypothetical protein